RFAYERQTRTQPDEERNDRAGGRTRHERIVKGDNEEPRARACRRKQEQRSHSLVVAEADVNEAMREVVTSSSPDRTSLGEPDAPVVERQEANARARHGAGQYPHDRVFAHEEGRQRESPGRDRRGAGGQTVDVVEQVEAVHRGDEHERPERYRGGGGKPRG